ncbi:MAG TPA: amidohydrolase family protein [Candidatus Paceibacterota bacterium]|nr:amidohydrolase family protein [Candidatus Paceibacterota bacterium]
MTLLIKNVQIVGGPDTAGTGAKAAHTGTSDVFVSDDKISAIGTFANKDADVVLDGQGAYLCPGFIDSNTDSDHYLTLFDDPGQEDFIHQGVATIMGGMCGASLAPLLYGSLESLQKWGDPNRINVNWHTMGEFFNVMDKRPVAVNFGTLVGHATVRRAIIGESLRDLTKNELGVFARTLETALQEGAFGMSSGLAYVHAHKTPYAELRALAEIVKKHNGVYATHLRNEGTGIRESVEEAVKLARETGVSTLINHFVPIVGAEGEYEDALALINDLPKDVDLHFDISPSTSSLMPIYTFLPEWAQNGGIDVMRANIQDEWLAPRIKKDIAPLDEDNLIIAQAPGNEILVGRTLAEIRDIYEVDDSRDALVRLMQALLLKGSVLYRNLDPKLIGRALASKRSLIGSNAPSVGDGNSGQKHFKSDRTTSTFSAFLSMAEEHKMLPFEEAIRKITLAPAKKFGLKGRGTIKEGNYADLVCLRGGDVKFTVVNGRVVEKEGAFQSTLPGKTLRHTG